MNAC